MLKRWQFWLLNAMASAVAAAMGVSVWAQRANRELQSELTQRAQYLQQSAQLDQVHREMLRALTLLAQRDQDEALRGLLARQVPPK